MPRVTKTNRHYLTDITKGQIISLHNIGTIPAEISRQTVTPARTVSNFIDWYTTRDNHKDKPRSGGPRKSTAEEDLLLLHIA